MKIENPKDLKKLIDMCRKCGIDEIEVDGIKLKLGALPERPKRRASVEEQVQEAVQIEGLTPEQLLFYSAGEQ